ncbi:MAG: hypothetical protein ABII90_02050 [Bacteroidota bacterium]
MLFRIRKYTSIFFLVSFISTFVIKEIHAPLDFHIQQVPCSAKTNHHFHEQHQDCLICNFNISYFDYNIQQYDIITIYFPEPVFPLVEGFSTPASFYNIFLRAPPFQIV